MTEQISISVLKANDVFSGFLLVKGAELRTGKNGSSYLDMTLCDRTGEINAKKWDGNTQPPVPGSVIQISGSIQDFNGRLQLRVNQIRVDVADSEIDYRLLVPSSPRSAQDMLQELYDTVSSFTNSTLRGVTSYLLEQFESKLQYFPAAQRIHHAERGGLLHHTTDMLHSAQHLLQVYPWLNRDLLLAGVIVHDLCKTEEMDSNQFGIVRDYTREGLLLGHLVLGVTRIQEAADALKLNGEEILLLQHMMLSHHGEADYGSPKAPMFPEAEVLHWIDMIDARLNEMHSALGTVTPGAFTDKIWSLDRRLYHTALASDESITADRK